MRLTRSVYASCLLSVFTTVIAKAPLHASEATVPRTSRLSDAEQNVRPFQIPAGDASEALVSFSSQAGAALIYVVEQVKGVITKEINGQFRPRDALERMLVNTTLTVSEDEQTGVLMVKRRPVPPLETHPTPTVSPNTTPPSMKKNKLLAPFAAFIAALTNPLAEAQSTTASNLPDPILLSPFEVTGNTEGYMATNSISGTAMNTPLKDVPMAINVITAELISDMGVTDMTDILKMNASITMQARAYFTNRGANWTIRGFGTRNLLVDGVTGGNQIPPQLIDRVEIVKGPNTLYGQSDPGGLINIITKRPLPVQHQRFSALAGSDGQLGFDLDVNTPLANGAASLRLLAGYSQTDGYRRVDGEEINYLGLVGEIKLSAKTTFLFNASGRESDGVAAQRSTFSFEVIPTDLNGDGVINNTVVRGVREATARYNARFLPPDFTTSTADNKMEWSNWYLSTGLRHAFTPQIMGQYNYVNTQQRLGFTSREFNTFNASGVSDVKHTGGDETNRTNAHTLQLAMNFETGNISHRVLVGGRSTADTRRSDVYDLRALGPASERNVMNQMIANGRNLRLFLTKDDVLSGVPYWLDDVPTKAEAFALGTRVGAVGESTTDVNSAYITDSVGLMDNRLKLLAGLRYVEIKNASQSVTGSLIGNVQESSDSSYQLGVVYDLTPNLVVFGNTATAFNPNSPDSQTGQTREPERSLAYEIGLKFENLFSGRLSGTVSLFEITKENLVRSDYNPVTFSNVTEISDDESKGIDTELFITLKPQWQVVLGYTHMKTQVVKSQTAALGLPLEGAPPDKATLWTSYEFASGPLKGLRFGGGGVFVRGPIQQFGVSSNRLVVQRGYTELNLFARYETAYRDHKLGFGLNVNNLTDKFYLKARAASNTPRQIIFSTSLDW